MSGMATAFTAGVAEVSQRNAEFSLLLVLFSVFLRVPRRSLRFIC